MVALYALYVLNESRAHRDLTELGFDVWRPTYDRLNRARKALQAAPLLSSYILVRIPTERFHEALGLPHVAYVVSQCGAPRPIPEDTLSALRDLVAAGTINEALPPQAKSSPIPDKSKKPRWNKSRARGIRKRGMNGLNAWFAEGDEPLAHAA